MNSIRYCTHGGTYGGNPIASLCDWRSRGKYHCDRLNTRWSEQDHEMFVEALTAINDKYHVFKDIRSMGLLIDAEVTDELQGLAKTLAALKQA